MYLIGESGRYVLFDCGWQDSFPVIRAALKKYGVDFEEIFGVLVSHFHPDHAGTVGLLCRHGVRPLLLERQMPHIAWLNEFFLKTRNDPCGDYVPLDPNSLASLSCREAQEILRSNAINGEILYTPGHSDDSISLLIGDSAFIGDLQPYDSAASWEALRQHGSANIYAGHHIFTMPD